MGAVLVLVIVFAVVAPALMLALATAAEDSLERSTSARVRTGPSEPSDG